VPGEAFPRTRASLHSPVCCCGAAACAPTRPRALPYPRRRALCAAPTPRRRAGLKLMEGHGMRAEELRLVGGGSKNPLWRRIVADAFQLPVRCAAPI